MILTCRKCEKPEKYDGGFPLEVVTSKILEFRCKSCQDKGWPILYKEIVRDKQIFPCPSCKLDSEEDFEGRKILGPCTQCDACKQWFHRTCLHLDVNDVIGTTKPANCRECLYKKRMKGLITDEIRTYLREKEIFKEIGENLDEVEGICQSIRDGMKEREEEWNDNTFPQIGRQTGVLDELYTGVEDDDEYANVTMIEEQEEQELEPEVHVVEDEDEDEDEEEVVDEQVSGKKRKRDPSEEDETISDILESQPPEKKQKL